MSKPPILITFFHHSCVAVEIESSYFLFDYFPREPFKTIPFPEGKKIYIFSSHGHHDHYNTSIFKENFAPSPVTYVLSDDIQGAPKDKTILWVNPHNTYHIDDLAIRTFGSTDLGVSFLVSVNSLHVFHSGDLNWWHWKHFSKKDQELEKITYQNEIRRLPNSLIDLAFVPVDPRLGEASHLAANYFIEQLNPRYLVPIHLQVDFKEMKSYAQAFDPEGSRVLIFEKAGEKKKLQF